MTKSNPDQAKGPNCVGSKLFRPAAFLDANTLQKHVDLLNRDHNLWQAICESFGIPPADRYVYAATSTTTLLQTQRAIQAGRSNGLHGWYKREGTEVYPTEADIEGYIGLFNPSVSASNALKNFLNNAKKSTLRAQVGQYLSASRFTSSKFDATVPKSKQKQHANPYFDFWAWSCRNLEWAGPTSDLATTHASHHVLVILMLHFGCSCPSYESLALISKISKGNTIIDMGSGCGYWTWLLRAQHGCQVVPVDTCQSRWRVTWIEDTLVEDGIEFLEKRMAANEEHKSDTLLLVYPIVGMDFTSKILSAFQGQYICVAGNQNKTGYTAFKDQIVSEWMTANRTDFELVARLPLPSFAGKDDALFVFQRKAA